MKNKQPKPSGPMAPADAGFQKAYRSLIARQGGDRATVPTASPTHGMNLGERIAHVGGRINKQGYIEFGSAMAVDALIQHVLRDTQGPPQKEAAGDLQGQIGDLLVRLAKRHPADSLTIATGIFVSLLTSYMRAQGFNTDGKIHVDGGKNRDITVHEIKGSTRSDQEGA